MNCMGPGQTLGGGKSEPGFGVTWNPRRRGEEECSSVGMV